MKILLTGKNGQVGYELERSLQGLGELIALDRAQMDLADLARVRDVIRTVKPDLIVNAAAYTAVDKAESEPELAMRINGEAPAVMAEEARRLGAAMIHYSTDYVFDGTKSSPYTEKDIPSPINMYGRTKLAGEQAIQAADIPYLIFRTSWVYGMRRSNFLLTVLRLARECDELRIVADQHGSPTWCRTIAGTSAYIVAQMLLLERRSAGSNIHGEGIMSGAWQEKSGIYHLTSQGQTTWYGFTTAILNHYALSEMPVVIPVTSHEYPLPAPRPGNSVLSCDLLKGTFWSLPDWQYALKLCME